MSYRCLLCCLPLFLASCGLFQRPVYQEQGLASYIADSYIGRPTASGQYYQPYYYTAAHNGLPLGTGVTVTNLQTGQSANVVINDRFPYYPGRVINLSSAAAQAIGIPYKRMAQVKVTARGVPSGQQQARNASSYDYNTNYTSRYNSPAPPQPVQPRPQYQPGPKPRSTYNYRPQSSQSGPNAPAYTGGNTPPSGLRTY